MRRTNRIASGLRSGQWVIPLLLPLLLGGCELFRSRSDPDPIQKITGLPRALSAAESEVLQASNDFAFDLFREVVSAEPGDNVFLSPLSISMALGMTLNGSTGDTWEAMRSALRLQELNEDAINTGYRDLIALLLGLDRSIQVGVANSVWHRNDWVFLSPFLEAVQTYFDAHVRGLDFSDPTSRNVINTWVAEQTNDRIQEIVEEIKAEQVMFLVNAVYFKAPWVHPFKEGETYNAAFHLEDGTTTPVRMMRRDGPVDVFHDHPSGVTLIDLPYGGGAFSMTIALPPPSTSLATFIEQITAGQWAAWLASSFDQGGLGGFHLPRFKLEYDIELEDVLTTLGMGIAFQEGAADFSRMIASPPLYIDEVIHKTFVEVNEEGTEAAAATSVGMMPTSVSPTIIVDRPFVYLLRERFSGTILFVGSMFSPPYHP